MSMEPSSISNAPSKPLANLSTILLIPNLIGYFRIFMLVCAVAIAFVQPFWSFIAFFISGLLDMADGYCARRLKQESKMGAVLDFAIDRSTDVAIFMILVIVYPKAWIILSLILMLDIFSHICQLYSTIFLKIDNHKLVDKSHGILLWAYYTKRAFLVFGCLSYGLLLAMFYLYHFYPMPVLLYLILLFAPGFIFKVVVHCLQITRVFRVVSQMG